MTIGVAYNSKTAQYNIYQEQGQNDILVTKLSRAFFESNPVNKNFDTLRPEQRIRFAFEEIFDAAACTFWDHYTDEKKLKGAYVELGLIRAASVSTPESTL